MLENVMLSILWFVTIFPPVGQYALANETCGAFRSSGQCGDCDLNWCFSPPHHIYYARLVRGDPADFARMLAFFAGGQHTAGLTFLCPNSQEILQESLGFNRLHLALLCFACFSSYRDIGGRRRQLRRIRFASMYRLRPVRPGAFSAWTIPHRLGKRSAGKE